jgi:hypothetical protein
MPSPGKRWALAIVAYEPLGLVAEPAHSTVAGSRAGSSPTKAELRAENARLREEVARLQVQLHELGGMPDAQAGTWPVERLQQLSGSGASNHPPLACEAERRGYAVEAASGQGSMMRVVVGGHGYELTVVEGKTRVPHVPSKEELADAARYSWTRIPDHDYIPSGELELRLPPYYWDGRRHRWSDRKRWRLEDKLAHVLAEIEERAELDEQRRLAEERRAQERRRAHEQALEGLGSGWSRHIVPGRLGGAAAVRRDQDRLSGLDGVGSTTLPLHKQPRSTVTKVGIASRPQGPSRLLKVTTWCAIGSGAR